METYTVIENYWNGWAAVFLNGQFVTLAASIHGARQFIALKESE